MKLERFIPDQKDVKQILKPGIWIDHEDRLHFCPVTFLESHGHTPTPSNVKMAEDTLISMLREQTQSLQVITVFKDGKTEIEGAE